MAEIIVNGKSYRPVDSSEATRGSAEARAEDAAVSAPALLKLPSRRVASELRSVHPQLRASFMRANGYVGSKPGAALKVRLPVVPTVWRTLVSPTSTLSTIFGIQATSISGVGDWQAVFAEYRIMKGVLMVTPLWAFTQTTSSPVTTGPYVAVGVEYDSDVTLPASIAEVIQNDQSKIITHAVTKPHVFAFDLTKMFGEVWTDTGTNAVFASLKGYGLQYGATQMDALIVSGYFDMEYRGFA